MNPEQKEGIHRTVVQGQAVVNVQAPPGTGKTETAANLITLEGVAQPGERIIVVAPTNLAGEKLGRGCVESLYRFGASKTNEDYDILLLESRFAALSAAEKETAVIKPIQENDNIVEKLKLAYHVQKILDDIKVLESDNPDQDFTKTAYPGWDKATKFQFERYLEAKARDSTSRLNEEFMIDRVLDWQKSVS